MSSELEKKQPAIKAASRYNELVAIILLAFAMLIFLCLVSYNQMDSALLITEGSSPKNWIGIVGASIAGFLIDGIFGWISYIFPAFLAFIAWRTFRSETLIPSSSKIIGFVLFLISSASFVELIGGEGAITGAFFSQPLIYLLNPIGAGILLFTLLTISILLLTNFSFFGFFGNFDMARENFRIHFDEWQVKREAKREAKRQADADYAKQFPEQIREKPVKTKPTISLGDTPAANIEIKTDKKGKVSILDSLKAADEAGKEDLIETLFENKEEEIPFPTISVAEQSADKNLSELNNSFIASAAEDQIIPITPVKHTGDLNGEFIEENDESERESEPEPPKKPQNYDNYILPTTDFLVPSLPRIEQKDEELLTIAQELTGKTKEFNVTGRVMHICQGPVVTTYEFKPDPGVKYSRVTGLADDLCLALKAESIRIDRIPGKAVVGIEVPNRERETIQLREVIESKKFKDSSSMLSIALGKSIDGLNYVADLAKMPHLLIAGATGAGKSVGVNTLIVSILYKAKPDEVKLIMVDPKQVELGIYADIPHLATPIITDPKRAAISLKWAVGQMERRYKDLAGWGVRNIDGYNAEVKRRNEAEQLDDNGEPWKKLPFLVIIIDELADLMMVAGKEVEESITRLAQMARAVGIHLVLATQRPSVDVITGLIKANFPSRISFRVSSKVDSRTIIDANGAESLLGKGDMLFLPPGTSNLIRVHGAFVDEKEINKIVEHVKTQGRPEYDTTITKTEDELDDSGDLPGKRDPLFWDALKTVVRNKSASTSHLQRHLRVGYGRAAAILDAMVREGYIGEMDGSKRARPILQKAYDDLQDLEEMGEV